MKELLSIAPLIGGTVNSFTPDSKFEVGSLPNAQEATRAPVPERRRSPPTTARRCALETRASLALPVDVTGLDTYGLFFVLGFSVFRFAM